jgi:hypothetical protein
MAYEDDMQEVLEAIKLLGYEIHKIENRIDQLEVRMNDRFDDVDTILDRLDTRTRTIQEDQAGIVEWLKFHDRLLNVHWQKPDLAMPA